MQKLTNASNAVAWQTTEQPFGETVSASGTPDSKLRFPGQYADSESGLRYNYFRDYNPALGRYLQPDPIGQNGGLNLYGYANQNPIRWTDPSGLIIPAICYGIAEGAAACAANPACAALTAAAAVSAYGAASGAFNDLIDNIRFNEEKTDPTPAEKAKKEAEGSISQPDVPAPEAFDDPKNPPEGWEWKGKGEPGSREGAWTKEGESVHDDRSHPPPKPPHMTYTDKNGKVHDNYLDGNGWQPRPPKK